VKRLKTRQSLLAGIGLIAITALAGCAPKAAPPPMIVPPPVVVVPPQPMPPRGASPKLVPPPINALGVRQTVNVGLTPAQTTWNLRSAYNVAALNCTQPEHEQIVVNYRAFLKSHAKKLDAANKEVDKEFKAKHGARFIPPRETFNTQVYNYFALPPTLPSFCDAALVMSNEAAAAPVNDFDAFAARSLPMLETVFVDFYRSYDQYRTDLAAWQAKYMSSSAASPVALQLPSASSEPQAQAR
jgi:hypothetical protein